MKPIREYLDIVFRRIQPEMLIANLRAEEIGNKDPYFLKLNSREIDGRSFYHYSHLNLRNYSADETEDFYYDMKTYMREDGVKPAVSVFHMLPKYMEDIIVMQGDIPCCKYLEMLNWRSTSLNLGQNLLITAYLAREDQKIGRKRRFFAWNSVIGTDNVRLHHMLEKGLSENHYHLFGSTQAFSLSWGCLMNHPVKIPEFFKEENAGKRMAENLNENITLGILDNQIDWVNRLYIACWIRQALFQCLKSQSFKNGGQGKGNIKRELLEFIDFPDLNGLTDCVDTLRYTYGKRFCQPGMKGDACLDYAIGEPEGEYEIHSKYRTYQECNRFLTGERRFLYDCFYCCYDGIFEEAQQDAFYLYLLIKSQFRSELIQVNRRTGFHNFSEYQDRKSDFWQNVGEYLYEAYRLAVRAPLQTEAVASLEVRIAPSETEKENERKVFEADSYCHFEEKNVIRSKEEIQEFGKKSDYFFVIHFIKEKLEHYEETEDGFVEYPRNRHTRRRAQICAKAIRKGLTANAYYSERVCGIDAASTEIGCRPETFATEFRFLRTITGENSDGFLESSRVKDKKLWITYHVGEDFLDIADGLRAIDEAVLFLELQRGDRLGHALALGTDPKCHYSLKQKMISLPKQDLLDNYVWLLFRSLEMGIVMTGNLKSRLQYEAQKLLYYIYPDEERASVTLREYYESWKLRGDHPSLYSTGAFCDAEDMWYDEYEMKKKSGLKDLQILRQQKKIAHLYYRYHFEHGAKVRGQEIQMVAVTDEYIALMAQMQKGMQKKIGEKGIGIECNPSSNVLIGTFQRYDKHPIFRFNHYILKNEDHEECPAQLNVSINTDDQGVFDTSLENEYALMACALEKMTDETGAKIYGQDAVYDYLDHVRQMGVDQTFRKE